MASHTLSPASSQIEALLDRDEKDSINDFLGQESLRHVEMAGCVPSSYDIFAVRRNHQLGDEIFGPRRLHVGSYSDEELYGIAGSPAGRFRSTVSARRVRVERASSLDPAGGADGHQTALVWTEIGRLKDFIGISPIISEIVAELRTARFQFLGMDTPLVTIRAVAAALCLVGQAKRLDAALVDQVVEALESGGVDSLAPDALREAHG